MADDVSSIENGCILKIMLWSHTVDVLLGWKMSVKLHKGRTQLVTHAPAAS